MSLPTNGITPEVIRESMPPYQLSADLRAAMFASIPPPPPDATQAWRLERATRLVQEIAGLMPADAPQARIAAALVIVREATDDTFARVNEPGLTVEQICRLRRTGSALTNSSAALERMLARHQQKPVPFFGTVLADGIDVAALAAGWGGPGTRRDDAGVLGGSEGASADGQVAAGMAGTTPGTSAPPGQDARWQALVGQGLPAMTRERGPDATTGAGPDDAMASGADGGGSTDGLVPRGMAGTSPAMTRGLRRRPAPPPAPAPAAALAPATERHGPPHPRADADPSLGVVTRLDQGPGWTLDVVRPRTGGDAAVGAAPEPVA
jgi:hypothetical protein